MEIDAAFAAIDTDGTGEITYDEFQAFWRTDRRFESLRLDEGRQTIVRQLTEYFRFFDEDFSGELDAVEFQQLYDNLLTQGYNLPAFDETMAIVDKTGDGLIGFNEFMSWMIGMGCLEWG